MQKKFLVLLNLHFSELRCYLLATKIQKNLKKMYLENILQNFFDWNYGANI